MLPGGQLFEYNDYNIRSIEHLLKESQPFFNKATIVGETTKRCPPLKPIYMPDLVKIIIDHKKELKESREREKVQHLHQKEDSFEDNFKIQETLGERIDLIRKSLHIREKSDHHLISAVQHLSGVAKDVLPQKSKRIPKKVQDKQFKFNEELKFSIYKNRSRLGQPLLSQRNDVSSQSSQILRSLVLSGDKTSRNEGQRKTLFELKSSLNLYSDQGMLSSRNGQMKLSQLTMNTVQTQTLGPKDSVKLQLSPANLNDMLDKFNEKLQIKHGIKKVKIDSIAETENPQRSQFINFSRKKKEIAARKQEIQSLIKKAQSQKNLFQKDINYEQVAMVKEFDVLRSKVKGIVQRLNFEPYADQL